MGGYAHTLMLVLVVMMMVMMVMGLGPALVASGLG